MLTHHHRLRGVSKTQATDLENADLEKKKKRRTKGLKFITLSSKGCFCICDTSVFSRSLFARSAFSRSAFSSFARERIMAAMNLNPLVRLFFFFCYLLFFSPCKQTPRKHRRVTNTKTAFARERNEVKSLSSSFLFLFEVCVFETPSAAD